jgi:FkbM family methyltransferase
MRVANLHCHSFLPELASRAEIAFDCGANHGDFARWLSGNTTARIYSFEPDPRLYAALPVLPRVTYFPLAIDGSSGFTTLALGDNTCSSMVYKNSDQAEVQVATTSLDDFCTAQGIDRIDFLKLDIEGAELSTLENMRERLLRSIAQITVEFHDFFSPADVPRIRAVVQRLRDLDFYFFCFSHYSWGDCLFLNKHQVDMGLFRRAGLLAAGKYLPGAARFVRRKLGMT